MLSRCEKTRKADWNPIKNLKCQTELFIGCKEGLEDFKVGKSELSVLGNNEQNELGSKEIIWKLVKQFRVEVTRSLNSES